MEPTPGLFYRPRVLISLGLALTIVVVTFFTVHPIKQKEAPKDSVAKVTDSVREGVHEDLDADGLERWQESMWGTDPKNKDTDGDGASDGVEVEARRSPLVKGPNDKLDDLAISASTTTTNRYEDDPSVSTTDVLSRDILSAYLAMKQSGTYSQSALNELIAQLAEKSENRSPASFTLFASSSVTVASDDTQASYTTYANTLGLIFAQFRDETAENELLTFTRSLEKKDPSILAPLKVYEESYRTIAKLLIATPVPRALTQNHLSLANSYVTLAESLVHLRAFAEDPAVHMAGLGLYTQAIASMNSSLPQIRVSLVQKGVVLTPEDPGASLFGMMGQ